MHRRSVLRTVVTLAATGVGSLAGCAGDGSDETPDGGFENPVDMRSEGARHLFDPIGRFVESGATVTFHNVSGSHSATAYTESTVGERRIPVAAEEWNSTTLSTAGAIFQHTFEEPGTYDYFCIPHRAYGMVGRIVVGEPGGPAEESEIPDGAVPDSATIVEQGTVSATEFLD